MMGEALQCGGVGHGGTGQWGCAKLAGMSTRPLKPPGWYVISLRPRGGHDGLRRAAARAGAGLIALSPCRLVMLADSATRQALARALAAPVAVFTSPAAVRAAARLQPLAAADGQLRCAVGSGTAAALRRAGVRAPLAPERMDSEGVLALPALQGVDGQAVGLVTAPGGRGLLAPALQARGARVQRADVYERIAVAPAASAVAALCAIDAPMAVALSSAEALAQVLAALPAAAQARLRRAQALAASERLAALAHAQGFADVRVARSPRPGDLVAAASIGR